jgi:hypothetical protein
VGKIMAAIYTNCGEVILVDEQDYDELIKYSWHIKANTNTSYAVRNKTINGKRTKVYMHRSILQAKDGQVVDHRNGDGLDNRRTNIRLCTREQNNRSVSKRRTNTSGYKGVTWHGQRKKWQAYIKFNGIKKSLGLYINKHVAAQAYNVAAKNYHGEFAILNEVICQLQ